MQSSAKVLQGRLLTDATRVPEPGWIRIEDGRITEMSSGDPPKDAMPPTVGGRDRIISPAFIDAHTHLPQVDSVGCDGMPLLQWLDQVIFPAEMWWGRGQAMSMARTAVRRMATQGTVGFAAYLTSHGAPNREVLSYLQSLGWARFVAGRVAMDRAAPDDLTAEDRERARLRPTPSPVLGVESSSDRHVASTNPRFAIACSDELMAEIGWYADEHAGLWIQTHLSESPDEVRRIAELFPDDPHYTAVYDRFHLLTARTLLAHAIHLSDEEWALIKERDGIVVHCPTANVFLGAGLFNLDKAREFGVRTGLGTDVAAGPDVAMPRVARAMIETAKVRRIAGIGGAHVPSPGEAWTTITRTNADLLGWTDCGRLEVGAAADLLVLRVPETWLDQHVVGRLLYNWSSSLIESRVFGGAVVDPARI